MKSKDVLAGMGEIGKPLSQLFKKSAFLVSYDISPKLCDLALVEKTAGIPTTFLHVCIPFNKKFSYNLKELISKFDPKCVVIHSTISPHTTKKIQSEYKIPIIYSATRGVHKRMLQDFKRYKKFYSLEQNAPRRQWASRKYSELLKKCGVRPAKMSSPLTLELAKIICDTSYYGWLITYSQLSNMIAIKNKIDYDEMWSFADEIHKILGNRPKMFPGYIGGHCVIPNLDLIRDDALNLIKEINDEYLKKIPNAKSINKKHSKSKKLSYDV